MTAIIATYPMDVARTRLAGILRHDAQQTSDGASSRAPGMTRLMFRMAREEGLRSWYRGVGPTLLGALPYEGIKFAMYGILMDKYAAHYHHDKSTIPKLLCGAIAGTVAGLAMFPNDVVRKLLQMDGYANTDSRPDGSPPFRSAWDCWKRVYAEHGIARFYRGVVPYLLRLVPGSAIQFGAYETLKDKQRIATLRRKQSAVP